MEYVEPALFAGYVSNVVLFALNKTPSSEEKLLFPCATEIEVSALLYQNGLV